MKLTSIALALLALAAGLVIAGCGDDDSDTGTKAGFIAAADEICEEADAELSDEAQAQYPEGPPTGDDATAFGEDVVIPNLEQQYDGIAALPVPEGEEDAVADILTKLRSGIDAIKENPRDFVESTALEDAAAAAKAFGLKECGS